MMKFLPVLSLFVDFACDFMRLSESHFFSASRVVLRMSSWATMPRHEWTYRA